MLCTKFKLFIIGSTLSLVLSFVITAALVISSLTVFRTSTKQNLALLRLRGEILLKDEILTSAARLAAYSGNRSYIDRYNSFVDGLTMDINEALNMMPAHIQKEVGIKTNASNDVLVDLETRALNLAAAGNTTEATQIMIGSQYSFYKKLYAEGVTIMTDYILTGYNNVEVMETAVYAVVIVFMSIMVPWVIIVAILSIYCEVNMKREITFMSELLLRDTLSNSTLLAAFEKYATTEHSLENVTCWKMIRDYTACANETDRLLLAQAIVNKYLSSEHPELNVTERIRKTIVQHVSNKQAHSTLFEAMQCELEHVMTDTHGRFKRTPAFKEAVKSSTLVPNVKQ